MNIKPSTLQKQPSKPPYLILLVSLLLHLGIVLLIALAATKPPLESKVNLDKQIEPALKSYIFIPKAKSEVEDLSKPLQTELDSLPYQPLVDQIIETKKVEPPKEIEKAIQVEQVAQSPLVQDNLIDQQPLEKEANKTRVLTSNSDISETTIVSDADSKYKALVSKHLADYHSNYSQQQAQEYRSLKKSPIITTSNSINTNEAAIVAPIINVDCNNTGSQVIAVISGLMNGTVKCESNNNFQKYIDQRLNPIPIKEKNPPKITNKVTLKAVEYVQEENSDDVN